MHELPVTRFRAGAVYSAGSADVESFAVGGGRIIATGAHAELADRFPGAPCVDLGDRLVVPGFNDAHAHFADAAQGRLELDVAPAHAPDAPALLRRLAGATPRSSGWVIAAGYDDSLSGAIDREALDAALPDRPVLIRHVSAHWAVLNSAALRELGIDETIVDGGGGSYGRDGAGRLDGRIYERALLSRYVSRSGTGPAPIPAPRPAEVVDAYRAALAEWNAYGITSSCDAFVGGQQLGVHTAAHRAGQRSLRVGMLLAAECYDDYAALGLGTGMGDEWLRIAGVKAFVDGAIGGRTCFVSEPFCGTHDHGLRITSPEELHALVRRVHGDGNRLGIHANGDAAIRMLLDAYEAAQRDDPRPTRHRIEHCSIVDDDIIRRIAALDLIVTPFARYASFYGGRLERWYGKDRTERMFAHRALLDAGVTVAASTDHPASPVSPFAAMQSLVTRTGDDGSLVGAVQRITPAEALAVYTAGSAAATGEERRKGRLLPGMLADFAVLDADPRAVDPFAISEIAAVRTYVDGELVFSRE
ncbi:amidohydrolase [Leucobacter allii]|uniref:amidohydrolase n=1 Tax=Leucobacter allii TaxID=2932247 RepID=UPI001FD184EB|nr:amidohydrolase [Leucobacter allii]UOR01106.1 amidohydrolase [Leucobacter allii]